MTSKSDFVVINIVPLFTAAQRNIHSVQNVNQSVIHPKQMCLVLDLRGITCLSNSCAVYF